MSGAFARIARLHRELAEAYELLDAAKPKKPRHRGPVLVTNDAPVSDEVRELVRARLARAGYRRP